MGSTQLEYKAAVYYFTIYTHATGRQEVTSHRSVLDQTCLIKDGRDRHIFSSRYGQLRKIIWQLAFFHPVASGTVCVGSSLFTMKTRDQLFGQLDLDVARVRARFALSFQTIDLIHGPEAQQLEVTPHQRIRDRHQLAVHDAGRFLDTYIVTQRLGHLLDAVQPFQQRHGQNALRLLPIRTLQFAPHQQVEFLIGAAKLYVRLERNRVVTLHQRVQEFVDGDRLIALITLVEVIALKHPRHGVLRRQTNEVSRAELVHPRGVERDFGFLGIENLEDLRLVGLGVVEYLLARQWRTSCALAARITDHAGEVTDQEYDLVAQILKLTKLINKDGVPQMQIRRRRVEPCLDTQRLATFDFFDQFGLDQQFICAALDQRQLLLNRLHTSPHIKGHQPYKISARLQVFAQPPPTNQTLTLERVASSRFWLYFIQLFHLHHVIHLFHFTFFKVKLPMIDTPPKAPPLYPKTHLLAASGIAALLSLALLVFPSSEVEAKRTNLALDLEMPADQNVQPQDAPQAAQATPEAVDSPFAQIDESQDQAQETAQAAVPPAKAPNPNHREIVVAKGDTLSTLFEKVGLPAATVHEVMASDKQARQFSKLQNGQVLQFELASDGQLKQIHTKLSDLETISLTRTATGFGFSREVSKPNVRNAYAHGVINSSLSSSAQRAGLSHSLTMDMANIFGYDVDFAQDIRKGDEFDVVYEQRVVNGKVVGNGNILSARFTNRGKTYTAVRYTNKQGNTNYYTAEGNSMRKAFIRTPVDFARISSMFSMGRKHPILNKIRAHKGVDYAAPRGTPIKATGDGKVLLAGRRGGYGNTVIIQHGDTYRTLYGHMQGFAKGVKTGGSVKQGQVIGYIGTTGLSTGPHLHYEFQVNGVHVDPLGQKLPMADPIAKSEKQRFMQQSQPLMARMDQEKATTLASNKR
ncbi:MAG: peptidase [Pseudomonas sp.]|nr:peptidase [Pseudomonas sp.]